MTGALGSLHLKSLDLQPDRMEKWDKGKSMYTRSHLQRRSKKYVLVARWLAQRSLDRGQASLCQIQVRESSALQPPDRRPLKGEKTEKTQKKDEATGIGTRRMGRRLKGTGSRKIRLHRCRAKITVMDRKVVPVPSTGRSPPSTVGRAQGP